MFHDPGCGLAGWLFHVHLERTGLLPLLGSMFCSWAQLINGEIHFPFFCLVVLWLTEREVAKSPALIVYLSISPFDSTSLVYFEAVFSYINIKNRDFTGNSVRNSRALSPYMQLLTLQKSWNQLLQNSRNLVKKNNRQGKPWQESSHCFANCYGVLSCPPTIPHTADRCCGGMRTRAHISGTGC